MQVYVCVHAQECAHTYTYKIKMIYNDDDDDGVN